MTRVLCGWAVGVAAVVAAGGGVLTGQEKSPFDPAKLIGKWESEQKVKDATAVVEFAAGGKFKLTGGIGDKKQTWEGTYTVSGAKLKIDIKIGDRQVVNEMTVLKLTADELHTEDAQGKKEELKRKL